MAATDNINVYQGDYFEKTYTIWLDEAQTVPLVTTGLTGHAQVREAKSRDSAKMADFTVNISANDVTIILFPVDSAALTDSGFFDVELVDPDGTWVKTYVKGTVNLEKEVTV